MPNRQSTIDNRHSWRHSLTVGAPIALAALLFSTFGCGAVGGQWAYLFAGDKGQKVAAQFTLTTGPLMIFIDDIHERLDWPQTREHLFNDLAQELLRTKSGAKIIPAETVDHLRRSVPDFNKRGCRELGEMAEAEQILWIEVLDFLAEEDFTEAGEAAYLTVSVKVINAQEKKARTRVRLWPTSPEGHRIHSKMTGAAVARQKTRDKITRELAADTAVQIAQLFHEHRERGRR